MINTSRGCLSAFKWTQINPSSALHFFLVHMDIFKPMYSAASLHLDLWHSIQLQGFVTTWEREMHLTEHDLVLVNLCWLLVLTSSSPNVPNILLLRSLQEFRLEFPESTHLICMEKEIASLLTSFLLFPKIPWSPCDTPVTFFSGQWRNSY